MSSLSQRANYRAVAMPELESPPGYLILDEAATLLGDS